MPRVRERDWLIVLMMGILRTTIQGLTHLMNMLLLVPTTNMSARKYNKSKTVVQKKKVRPLDKSIIGISQTAAGTTGGNITLYTATFPATITGLRWEWDAFNAANSTNVNNVTWIIYRLKASLQPFTISQTNAAPVTQPEEEVICWGTMGLPSNADPTNAAANKLSFHVKDSTKSMRKLQNGDRLAFAWIGDNSSNVTIQGAVQFFGKS